MNLVHTVRNMHNRPKHFQIKPQVHLMKQVKFKKNVYNYKKSRIKIKSFT